MFLIEAKLGKCFSFLKVILNFIHYEAHPSINFINFFLFSIIFSFLLLSGGRWFKYYDHPYFHNSTLSKYTS